jgi:hypothetical protein
MQLCAWLCLRCSFNRSLSSTKYYVLLIDVEYIHLLFCMHPTVLHNADTACLQEVQAQLRVVCSVSVGLMLTFFVMGLCLLVDNK